MLAWLAGGKFEARTLHVPTCQEVGPEQVIIQQQQLQLLQYCECSSTHH